MSKLIVNNLDTNKRQEVELSSVEALRIKKIINILDDDREMEMLHDQVIEALWDYRNKFDYWRLRSTSGFRSQVIGYEIKSTLNRLAFNVLNLSKLFFDRHYNDKKGACFVFEQTEVSDHKIKVNEKRQKIYNDNIRYLIGCKLRNRSQHGQLPISQFSSGFKVRKSDNKEFITFSVKLNSIELNKLGVPKTRIDDGAQFELTEILDGYVYAVSEMHFHNRSLIESTITSARNELQELINKAIAATNSEDCIIDFQFAELAPEYIGLSRYDLSNHLRKKHPYAIDYSRFAFDMGGY